MKKFFLLLCALLLSACAGVVDTPVAETQLPALHITTWAEDIHRREWQHTTVSLEMSGAYDFEPAPARIRGRGNSTWHAMGSKLPYRIRFDQPQAMFGSDVIARDWVLLANAMDYSLMRDYAAHILGELAPSMDFSPFGHFLHLYMNGEYRGVYMLTDQIQVHDGRVELNAHQDPALSEYFIEWCRHHRMEGDVYFSVDGIPFVIDYPRGDNLTAEHVHFVENFILRVNHVIGQRNYAALSQMVDIPSLVDLYLINEFTKNRDVGFSSMNFQIRQRDGQPVLVGGPIWDFDQSAGGVIDHNGYVNYSPTGAFAATENRWFRQLMGMPEFRAHVALRWQTMRDEEVPIMLDRIRYLSDTYKTCFERNFERWPNKLGQYLWRTPPSVIAIRTYTGQIDYLLDWFESRMEWMDDFLS